MFGATVLTAANLFYPRNTSCLSDNIQDVSPRKVSEGDATLDAVIAAGKMATAQEEEATETIGRSNSDENFESMCRFFSRHACV